MHTVQYVNAKEQRELYVATARPYYMYPVIIYCINELFDLWTTETVSTFSYFCVCSSTYCGSIVTYQIGLLCYYHHCYSTYKDTIPV